jgi:hypothetical protein
MKGPAIPVHAWGPEEARAGAHRLGPCYLAARTVHGCFVLVMPREVALLLRLDVRNHSPTGFEWGYGGSGPAQLSLALLLDALGHPLRHHAVKLYQRFKREVIGRIHGIDSWLIYKDDIIKWCEEVL